MATIRFFRPLASLVVAGALVSIAAPASAQDPAQPGVTIGLRYAAGAMPGVLVLPVAGAQGDSVRAIFMRDLHFGNRVTVIGDPEDPASSPVPRGAATNYQLYQRLGALAVVQANVTATGVTVSVHDVEQRRVARTRNFPVAPAANSPAWRLALHGIADEIEEWITGQRGIAQTQVAYVRGGRMYLTHSDGAVTTTMGDVGGTPLSPAWSPDGRMIAYSVLSDRGTDVYVRELSGAPRRLSVAQGVNVTPVFSPDGRSVVFAFGQEAGVDLYMVPVSGGTPRRITVGRGSDNLMPSFSPDGRRLAFTSGRTGSPQIWATDVDGSSPELLTPFEFGERSSRSNPDWSPDNRRIAFQSELPGGFQIFTLTLRDRNATQHTSEGANENPAWAPDGRHIVFESTRSGVRQLWVLDTESGRARQLTFGPGGSRMAAWSGRMGGAGAPTAATAEAR